MKIKKTYVSTDYLWLYIFFLLLTIKLTFSYLIVEHSYWIRHLPNNFEVYNIFGAPKNLTKNVEYLIIPILLSYILLNFNYLGRLKSTFLLSCTLKLALRLPRRSHYLLGSWLERYIVEHGHLFLHFMVIAFINHFNRGFPC